MGGKYPNVLQLLSQQGFQRGPTVPLPRAVGLRRDSCRLFRPAVFNYRQEIGRRIQTANGGDPSPVLPVLQQRVRRLGLLHKQQGVGCAEAEGDIQRAAIVFSHG